MNRTIKIEVENVNHPGSSKWVDRAMYDAMRNAYLKVVPGDVLGMTLAEISEQLVGHLPDDLFPNGAKAGWWAKTVQLDLEAKDWSNGGKQARYGCTGAEDSRPPL